MLKMRQQMHIVSMECYIFVFYAICLLGGHALKIKLVQKKAVK